MPPLCFHLLGPFQLLRHGRFVEASEWQGAKTRRLLLALLTHRGRAVSQDELLEWLWPGMPSEPARNCLYVAMSRLRRILEPDLSRGADSRFLIGRAGTYRVDGQDLWIDAEAFEAAYRRGLEALARGDLAAAGELLQPAVDHYRGDYLEEEPYADWCLAERERLRELFLDAKLALADALAGLSQHLQAIRHAEDVLLRDPIRERAYRRIMRSYSALGERGQALRAYERCRRILAEEMGLDPLPQTRELYEEVLYQDRQGNGAASGRLVLLEPGADWHLLSEALAGLPGGGASAVLLVLVDAEQRNRLLRALASMTPEQAAS